MINYLQKLFRLPNYIINEIRKLKNVRYKWSFTLNETCLKNKKTHKS